MIDNTHESSLVSIIIPCYKQAHLVAKAIQSALDQTYPPAEILVIDDGSPDDVPAALAPFGDRVRLIRQANAGLSAARNAGLAVAGGDCCLFLDSDDWLAPEALQKHVEARSVAGADVTVSGWREVDPQGNVVHERLTPSLHVDAFHGLLRENLAVAHCFLAPRSALLAAGGFDVRLRSCEDWEMWIKLAAAGCKFAVVPGALAFYLRYPGSMSKNRERMYDSVGTIVARWGRHHPGCRLCRDASRAAMDYWTDEYFRWDISPSLQRAATWGERMRVLHRATARTRRNPRAIKHLVKAIGRFILRRPATTQETVPP